MKSERGNDNNRSSVNDQQIGKVIKMSNHGWSTNERILKLNSVAVSYFSDATSSSVMTKIRNGTQKPKQSVPMLYVTEVGPLKTDKTQAPNDCEQVKKFKQAYDATKAFKVVFYSAALIDGPYDPAKFKKQPEKVKKSSLKTWYILVEEPDQTNQDWIKVYQRLYAQPVLLSRQQEESKR